MLKALIWINGSTMSAILQLAPQQPLVDQVHDRLLGAIADGTLAPGRRLTQDEIALMLGVSRQPVSHAIQVLRRRGLLVDAGKRGVAVAPVDGQRIRDLYQVREALDGLAAELAAQRFAACALGEGDAAGVRAILAEAAGLVESAPVSRLVDADVAFHAAIHALSGNSAIAETVAEQWPHFRRSMQLVLGNAAMRARVWQEHAAMLAAIEAGDAQRAGRLAREHTAHAGCETARRIDEPRSRVTI
jgi:DNA-binding GntR family transcriptional regulator